MPPAKRSRSSPKRGRPPGGELDAAAMPTKDWQAALERADGVNASELLAVAKATERRLLAGLVERAIAAGGAARAELGA